MVQSFGFTKQSAERIAKAVKWTEHEAKRNKLPQGWPLQGIRVVVGKADGAATAPASLTVSVYALTGTDITPSSEGAITDTGDNISAYTLFGDIDASSWVCCIFVGGFWLVIAAECPA